MMKSDYTRNQWTTAFANLRSILLSITEIVEISDDTIWLRNGYSFYYRISTLDGSSVNFNRRNSTLYIPFAKTNDKALLMIHLKRINYYYDNLPF